MAKRKPKTRVEQREAVRKERVERAQAEVDAITPTRYVKRDVEDLSEGDDAASDYVVAGDPTVTETDQVAVPVRYADGAYGTRVFDRGHEILVRDRS